MKRLFTLLSLCCLLLGTARAQGVSFDNLSETKYYYMKSGKNNVTGSSWNRGYIVMKSDGTNLTLQGITNPHNDWSVTDYRAEFNESTADKEAMWGVVKYTDINNTTYAIIYNAKNGKCFKSTAATGNDALAVMALAEEVGYYKFEAISGTNIAANSYRIRNVSTSNANYKLALAPGQATSSNKCVAAYSGTDGDGGVPICFIEVPEGNANGTFDNNIRKLVELRDVYGNARLAQNLMTQLGTYSSNEQFRALGTSLTTFRSTPTVANATSLQTAYSALVPLNCGNDFCYEIYHYKYGKSGSSTESGGRGMLAYDSTRPASTQRPATVGVSYTGFTSNGYSNPCDPGVNTRWGLYKNSAGTYYIYNEGYASRMMTAAGTSAWTENFTPMSIAVNSNQANTFVITGSSDTNNALGISLGYFQKGSKDDGDIRRQSGLADDGSKLMVRIVGLADAGAQNIIKAQLRRAEYPVAGYGYVGGLQTQAVVTGENRTAENAQLILDAQPLAIEAGKNYLIYSARNGSTDAFVTADPIGTKDGDPQDNNRGLKFSADATKEKSIVQFEAIDGEDNKYYIKHVNSGMYFGQLSKDAQGMLPVDKYYAGKYSLMDESTTDHSYLGLKEATRSQYVNIKISTTNENENNKLLGWDQNAPSSENSAVRIKPCESLEVALSAAGWSTYCSPVALTIPAVNGLHIYYVSSNQADAVYVKEITGTIPAKTPVLINGEANTTITFAIANDVTAIEGNKLMGTTMRRNGFSTETSGNPDVYGLKISDTSASFVPAYSATIPANKAVLPYDNIDFTGMTGEAATNAFRLLFDEEGATTGIAAAPKRNAGDNGLLRDLSGRIVAYPIAGQVYIKSNGQKIILK